MERLVINGERPLFGEVTIQGAKNSVLPILAATLLVEGESVIHNCPRLRDVEVAIQILEHLGCKVTFEENTITVNAAQVTDYRIPDDLMREMRSSIMFLGPILARAGQADLTFPGGCELGARPIDLHLLALRALGAQIEESGGHIKAQNDGLVGCDIHLDFPSVGATENIMMAAACATGCTRIMNCAREPEIEDLGAFLNKAGIRVRGAGGSLIEIEGRPTQKQIVHRVIPDRIVTSTYLNAALITGGKICLHGTCAAFMVPELNCLKQTGCTLDIFANRIYLDAQGKSIQNIKSIKTMPYPGFPTDAGAVFLAAMTKAKGSSLFIENIFESRFRYVSELCRMGADIKTFGKIAIVTGVENLYGTQVAATDLRGGAAVVLAALAAKGQSEITEIFHIDRGYEAIEDCLSLLGADIKRKKNERAKK